MLKRQSPTTVLLRITIYLTVTLYSYKYFTTVFSHKLNIKTKLNLAINNEGLFDILLNFFLQSGRKNAISVNDLFKNKAIKVVYKKAIVRVPDRDIPGGGGGGGTPI